MAKKQVALITGASRGIGQAIAVKLAADGFSVVINYNGSKEKADLVCRKIQEAGGVAAVMQCDVSDFEACKTMIDQIWDQYGRLDVLVNNAGVTKDGLLMRMSEADYDVVMNTNLKGTFNCTRHVSKYMLKQRSGRIINMASVVGVMGNAGQSNYAASKAGIIGLTKSVARELASRGVTANAVAPGFIETEMTSVLSEEVKAGACAMIPLGTFGRTEDVANAVAFLASDQARYITGQVIHVDGGMAM